MKVSHWLSIALVWRCWTNNLFNNCQNNKGQQELLSVLFHALFTVKTWHIHYPQCNRTASDLIRDFGKCHELYIFSVKGLSSFIFILEYILCSLPYEISCKNVLIFLRLCKMYLSIKVLWFYWVEPIWNSSWMFFFFLLLLHEVSFAFPFICIFSFSLIFCTPSDTRSKTKQNKT